MAVANPAGPSGYTVQSRSSIGTIGQALTPSDTVTFSPGAAGVQFNVSAAGNIKVGFPDGSNAIYPFNSAGLYQYNWSINQIFVTGSTATFTAYALN